MKYLGIDYGAKRVGIATGDSEGGMAFPHAVFRSDKKLISAIKELCGKENIAEIVLGESLDYKMKPNVIMEKITPFKKELEYATNLPVHFEREFMTSAAAEHLQGKGKMIDASAAAIILQSYLDKKKNNKLPMTNNEDRKPEEQKEEQRSDLPTAQAGLKNSPRSDLGMISIEDFVKLKIKIGKILSAEKVPEADKLIKLTIDVGEETPRQILSGIAVHYPDPFVLVGKYVPVLVNLAPRVIRGHESQGMILYAVGEEILTTVESSREVPPGTPLK